MSVQEVDAILAKLTKDKRDTLQNLRKTIKAIAPKAEEGISYGVPAFRYKGKPLAGYSAAKKHCSYFPMSPGLQVRFGKELAKFDTAKGTIRFPIGSKLPAALVKKIVKARMAEIDASTR